MLLLVVVAALLCSSPIQAARSITVFYPASLTESTCADSSSWTKWFNSAKPSDNGNMDRELHQVILAANGRDVCGTPQGMQAQSVSDLSAVSSYQYGWLMTNNIIAGFRSGTPGIDYEVRFCCANTDFETTTTTTTTPRPITSSTCGQAEIQNSFASRIFGGSTAIRNSWPWQVLYEQRKPCGNNQICLGLCGGTLIDSRHVLTASHCIDSTDPTSITITAGLHNKYNDESDTRQMRAVERIFSHPLWNAQSLENDITILRLAEPVQFNRYVQPACLPGPDPKPDTDVVLIGWGKIEYSGNAYHELKQTKVKVIGECNKYWGQVNEEKQVCVGNLATRDSACQGDSGGPMLYEQNGQWIVAGITSFGSPTSCSVGANFMPNVYTRVSAYLDWINSII
jgi:V8-like Glu-specific endopeptidase